MTTDTTHARPGVGPSVHVVRARKLLYAGLTGGLIGTAVCLVVFAVLEGPRGLGSAALGSGLVLFFYVAGQLMMVAFANAGARTLLSVALFSYTTRVLIVGLVLLIFHKNQAAWTAIDPIAIFISTVAVVAGWLIVEVIVFSRLRINAYDTENTAPSDDDASTPARSTSDGPGGTLSG